MSAEKTKRSRVVKKRTLDDVMTNASTLSTIDKAALIRALKQQVDGEVKKAREIADTLEKAVIA